MTKNVHSPIRRLLGVGLVSVLMLAVALVSPASANHGDPHPNAWVVYNASPGIPVYSPMTGVGYHPDIGQIACAGSVTVGFASGAELPLVGVSFGQMDCNQWNPPCDPYTSLPSEIYKSCTKNVLTPTLSLQVPYQLHGGITSILVGCLRTVYIAFDVNADGVQDGRSSDLTILGSC